MKHWRRRNSEPTLRSTSRIKTRRRISRNFGKCWCSTSPELKYRKDKFVVQWELQTVDAKPIAEPDKLKKDLEAWIKQVIAQYDTGLLKEGEDKLSYEFLFLVGNKKLTLAKATSEDFHRRVRAYLDTNPPVEDPLRLLVNLNLTGLIFQNTQRPGALTWALKAARDLGADEEVVREYVLLFVAYGDPRVRRRSAGARRYGNSSSTHPCPYHAPGRENAGGSVLCLLLLLGLGAIVVLLLPPVVLRRNGGADGYPPSSRRNQDGLAAVAFLGRP